MKSTLLRAWRGRPQLGRRRGLAVAAVALFVFLFLYRFATLGGALGGFDDDHFILLAYSKQVEAGERPSRDYLGLGLLGLWPPLAFDVSAGAQQLLGDNLRSEAVATAGVLAVGGVLTFAAGSLVAPPGWALAASLLAGLSAPKLYAFPKVLVLAGAALLLIAYARQPSARRAVWLAVLTAAAVLLRNDYAVYVSAGVVVLLAATAWFEGVRPWRHAAIWAGLTAGLLVPSLLFVQRHYGLGAYLALALENSTREAARTELSWPFFSLSAGAEANAEAWLYWFCVLVPVAAAVRAVAGRHAREAWRPAAALAVAATALLADAFLLRANLGARVGDVGPIVAVAGLTALGSPAGRGGGRWRTPLVRAVTAGVALVTVVAVWVVGSVGRELATIGWPARPQGIVERALRVSGELAALPAASWTDPEAAGGLLAAQYVNRCTLPDDRLLLLSYIPEVLPFSGRLFAGGVPALVLAANDDAGDAFVLERLRAQSVPLVLLDPEQLEPFAAPSGDPYFPRVHAYLRERYDLAGALGGDQPILVLAERSRVPVSTFGDTGLPCFR